MSGYGSCAVSSGSTNVHLDDRHYFWSWNQFKNVLGRKVSCGTNGWNKMYHVSEHTKDLIIHSLYCFKAKLILFWI
jgi:hypothetical protein